MAGFFANDEDFQATTEFVRVLLIFDLAACDRYFLDRLLTERPDSSTSSLQVLKAPPLHVFACFESIG